MENNEQEVFEDYVEVDVEDEPTTETENVETPSTEETTTTTETDVDAVDKQETKEEVKEVVSEEEKAKRAEFAEQKRQEKAQKQVDKAVENGEEPNLTGKQPKTNPFTGLSIDNEEDQKEYMEMLEAKSKGYDPSNTSQLSKFKREKRVEESKKAEEQQKWFADDKQKFTEKFPDVDLQSLIKETSFKKFAKGRAGKEPLGDIYSDYLDLEKEYEKKIQTKVNDTLSRVKSSPGSLQDDGSSEVVKKIDYNKWIREAQSGKLDN